MSTKSIDAWRKRAYQTVFFSLILLLIYVFAQLGGFLKEIFISFGVAIYISYLLGKPTNMLTKLIKVRALAIVIIFLLFFGALFLLGTTLYPSLVEQFEALNKFFYGQTFQNTLVKLDNLASTYNLHVLLESFPPSEIINRAIETITSIDYKGVGNVAKDFVVISIYAVLYIILVAVFSFYLLLDGKLIWEIVITPLTEEIKEHAVEIKKRVDRSVNAYILGQFQVAILTTVVMLFTYYILRVPYATVLGAIQMLEIIPVIGTWTAIIPGIIIVFFVAGPTKALIAFIVYLVYTQIIRDQIIAPRIMGSALGFHPIGVMIAVLIGTKLGGIIGVIFALPITASLIEVLNYFIEINKLKAKVSYEV